MNDPERIAEGIFPVRPALIVNGQLISNIRFVDHAMIEVLDAVRVEGELVVRVSRLAGIEITAQEIPDLRLGHVAGVLGLRRHRRCGGARFAQGRVAL